MTRRNCWSLHAGDMGNIKGTAAGFSNPQRASVALGLLVLVAIDVAMAVVAVAR